jgi:hypothetical protein
MDRTMTGDLIVPKWPDFDYDLREANGKVGAFVRTDTGRPGNPVLHMFVPIDSDLPLSKRDLISAALWDVYRNVHPHGCPRIQGEGGT